MLSGDKKLKLTRRLLREVILQEMKLLAEQEAGAEIDISDEDDVEEEVELQLVPGVQARAMTDMLMGVYVGKEGDVLPVEDQKRGFLSLWGVYGPEGTIAYDQSGTMTNLLRVASGQISRPGYPHGVILNPDGTVVVEPEPEASEVVITAGEFQPAGDPYSYDFDERAERLTRETGKIHATAVSRNGQAWGPATFEVDTSNDLHRVMSSDTEVSAVLGASGEEVEVEEEQTLTSERSSMVNVIDSEFGNATQEVMDWFEDQQDGTEHWMMFDIPSVHRDGVLDSTIFVYVSHDTGTDSDFEYMFEMDADGIMDAGGVVSEDEVTLNFTSGESKAGSFRIAGPGRGDIAAVDSDELSDENIPDWASEINVDNVNATVAALEALISGFHLSSAISAFADERDETSDEEVEEVEVETVPASGESQEGQAP